MRALVRQKKRFLVSKKKNRDRAKRSRRSDEEVSLDNADAAIEGAPSLTLFQGRGLWRLFGIENGILHKKNVKDAARTERKRKQWSR